MPRAEGTRTISIHHPAVRGALEPLRRHVAGLYGEDFADRYLHRLATDRRGPFAACMTLANGRVAREFGAVVAVALMQVAVACLTRARLHG